MNPPHQNRGPVQCKDPGIDWADASGEESAEEAADEQQVERRVVLVAAPDHGLRLDKWLVSVAPEFSRSHLQGLIAAGCVRCGDRVLDTASRKVMAGQTLEVELRPTAQSHAFRPEPMVLNVVFEDAHLMVVHKPAGLVVHPAAGHWSGTLLNGLLAHHAGAATLPRAGIVHRLDKDTSGLMVVAKNLTAQTALVRAIAAREVRREYLALVHGAVSPESFSVEAPIGRDPVSRVRMAVVASGKPARTDVRCLATREVTDAGVALAGRGRSISAVRCKLHTGRTHQIRVHLSHRGHPLVGDVVYGGKPCLGVTRQALHATCLAFEHPESGEKLRFEALIPDDLAGAWAQIAEDCKS